MLTGRGKSLLALAAGTLLMGRVLALRELLMTGAALVVVLVAGIVSVRLRKGTVQVKRTVWPSRTVAGQDVRVDLEVEASGRMGSGPLLLAENLPASMGEPVRLAVGPGRRRSVSYVVGPRMRGRYSIGPLDVVHTDAFGSAQRATSLPDTSALVVYPSHERLESVPGRVQRLGVVRHSPLLGQGDEFYALRAYEEGDDMRKVHWPTSAKLGELMIRQEELLGEPRVLVVLDTCAAKHRGSGPDSSLEAAVSACASVGTLALRKRMRIDVVTADGPLLHSRRPNAEEFLEALAGVGPSERGDIAGVMARHDPSRSGRAAALIVITPGLGSKEITSLAVISAASPGGALVLIEAASFARGAASRPPEGRIGALGLPVLRLRSGESFRRVWESGVRGVTVAR